MRLSLDSAWLDNIFSTEWRVCCCYLLNCKKKPLAGYWGGVCLKASHFLSLLGDIAQFAVFIPANNNKE